MAPYVVQVEEFCKCVYVRHLKSLTDGLLIIWGWSDSRVDETAQIDEEHSSSCNNSSSTEVDLSEDECVQSKETSTVNFKCIGVTRDALYQETLKKAFLATKEGKSVCVRLTPQPDNPYDSYALNVRWMAPGGCLDMLSRNFVTMFSMLSAKEKSSVLTLLGSSIKS